MYKEIETHAIAKKRYYFKKGYRQVTIGQKDEVREKLDTLVPDSANKPYDMHEVISGIIDEDSFFEIHKDAGRRKRLYIRKLL